MRAVWYERNGPAREVLTLGEMPIPEVGPGEATGDRDQWTATVILPAGAVRRPHPTADAAVVEHPHHPADVQAHFLRYAGRYIRRLPISQRRILQVTEQEVVYQSKDTRTKTTVETRCTTAEFLALRSQHVLDRYQHSMRYFGLLAHEPSDRLQRSCLLCSGNANGPDL